MNWTKRERAWLVLSIIGFVVPNILVATFFIRHGSIDGVAYYSAWFESVPSTQLAFDVTVTFVAFAIWALWEGRRLGMRSWWLPIPASALVGICFAAPLFLLMRERQLRRLDLGAGAAINRLTPTEERAPVGRALP